MRQLTLPLDQSHLKRLWHGVKALGQYAKDHPDEVMLALMAVLLLDIEDDIDDLGAK